MKVNTDGVLLGAAAILPVGTGGTLRALDAGTGTGVIALMLAQRLAHAGKGLRNSPGDDACAWGAEPAGSSSFCVTGIDIDEAAAGEAAANFRHSPWAEHLTALRCDLNAFVPEAPFDLIVSNPPFFEASLTCPEERKTLARHTSGEGMDYVDLLSFAQRNLTPDGHIALILPVDRETDLRRYAASYGLYPLRLLRIRTTPRKAPSRLIADFCRSASHKTIEEELVIQDVSRYPGNRCGYTPEYLALTGDFYLD